MEHCGNNLGKGGEAGIILTEFAFYQKHCPNSKKLLGGRGNR
jgi:hypothetical protein